MGKTRILEFLTYAGIGGTQHMFLECMRRMSHDTFQFSVCVLLEEGFVNESLDELGIEHISLNMRGHWDLGAWRRFYRFAKPRRFDLIRTYGLKAHLAGRLVGKTLRVPVHITSVRSTDPWRKWYHIMLDRATAGLTDLYLSNSKAGSQATHEREKIPLSKILTIPNGIDVCKYERDASRRDDAGKRYRQALKISPSTPVLGIIASFRKMKGHKTIVNALPAILAQIPDVKCLFIGDEFVRERSFKQELYAYVRQKHLENAITFTGPCYEIATAMSAIDIVVLPSLWEGLPVSLLEAMAMKKPVIASRVGGIPEVVVPGETGILIPPGDAQALANAAIHLLTDPERASAMGRAGYERVQRNFTIETVVTATEALYEQLIAQKK